MNLKMKMNSLLILGRMTASGLVPRAMIRPIFLMPHRSRNLLFSMAVLATTGLPVVQAVII